MRICGAVLLAGLLVMPVVGRAQAQNDHLKCYQVKNPLNLAAVVDLNSPQFGLEAGCKVSKAKFFCVPADKTVVSARDKKLKQPITPLPVSGPDPGDRICYKVKCPKPLVAIPGQPVTDQFGTRTVTKFKTQMLCAPAVKGTEYCGDGLANGNEQCDGTDDAACSGACQADCTCPEICPTPGPTGTAMVCPTPGPGPTGTAVVCVTPGPTRTAEICPTPGPASTATPPGPTATATPVPRFVDNGDGTVTDNQTGLQWEKKTTTVGSGVNLADAHDVDNFHTWGSLGGCTYTGCPNGSVFTDFLGRLNNCTSSDGTAVTDAGFAGHCDWRIPTVQELQTIIDLDAVSCGFGLNNPCIDPIFGPTIASAYWTATTFPTLLGYASYVNFFGPTIAEVVGNGFKGTNGNWVRAVRSR